MSADGYGAAAEGLALFDRSARTRLRVYGRAPRQMLDGIVTGTLPLAPDGEPAGAQTGRGTYHAVLTPKGKMITDLWSYLPGDEETAGFLLDVPETGAAALVEHLAKVLPPRLARVEDRSRETSSIAVVGPVAAEALSKLAFGLRVDPDALRALDEGHWIRIGADGTMVARTREVGHEAWIVLGTGGDVSALRRRLVEDGAVEGSPEAWDTLRIEAGTPAFGLDMTDATIPVEAGIHDRAIDYRKGCYTGQEVIVRIRDRGHVNRHLRRLELGDVPVPASGTELFSPDQGEKPVGWITSAARSPAADGVVALGYVRRGVDRLLYEGREVLVD